MVHALNVLAGMYGLTQRPDETDDDFCIRFSELLKKLDWTPAGPQEPEAGRDSDS